LFVGNISRNVSLKDLEEEFHRFGPCKINHRGGYAFIEYQDERDADEAKLDLHGKNMGGLCLNIEWSKRSGKFTQREGGTSRERQKDRCYNCGKPGHISRDCKEVPECYECGGQGHIARECQFRNGTSKRTSPPSSPESIRSLSIESDTLSDKFKPSVAVEVSDPHHLTMEDGTLFELVRDEGEEDSWIYKCTLCNKTMQKSSAKRHVTTKTHKEKLGT